MLMYLNMCGSFLELFFKETVCFTQNRDKTRQCLVDVTTHQNVEILILSLSGVFRVSQHS